MEKLTRENWQEVMTAEAMYAIVEDWLGTKEDELHDSLHEATYSRIGTERNEERLRSIEQVQRMLGTDQKIEKARQLNERNRRAGWPGERSWAEAERDDLAG